MKKREEEVVRRPDLRVIGKEEEESKSNGEGGIVFVTRHGRFRGNPFHMFIVLMDARSTPAGGVSEVDLGSGRDTIRRRIGTAVSRENKRERTIWRIGIV